MPISPYHPQFCSSLAYFLYLWNCLFRLSHINGIIQYLPFFVWHVSLSKMFSRFIHFAACIRILLMFMVEYYFIVYILFIHLLMAGLHLFGYCAQCYSEYWGLNIWVLLSILWGTTKLITQWLQYFTFLPAIYEPCPYQHFLFSILLNIAILVVWNSNLLLVLHFPDE